MISTYLNIIKNKENLTSEQATDLINMILKGELTQAQTAAVLMGLSVKGESIEEITAFAAVMREMSVDTSIDGFDLVDTCGTGGDGLNTFNISTSVAIISAAAGVKIAKHGNRSISSKSGSADVLKELGVKIDLSRDMIIKSIKENGIAFLFAPLMHGAMKNVMPVRKDLGIKTIFNYLGPLTNPSRLKKQVIGVCDQKLLDIYPKVLKDIGHTRSYIIRGDDGLDEASISTSTSVVYLNNGEFERFSINPEDFGLERASLSEIVGGDAAENAGITKNILANKANQARKDIVILNSAFTLHLADKASSLEEGVKIAAETIESGKALEFFDRWIEWNNKI